MTITTFPANTCCLICETPLTTHQRALKHPVCQRADCQWRFSRLGPNGRCEVCGRPLSRTSAAIGVCDQAQCQRTHHERQWQRDQAALRERALRLRDTSAPDLGIADPETYPVAVIPAFEARVVNLPERRRRAFRDRLTKTISEALSEPGPVPKAASPNPAAPELGSVLGRACASCQGFCCRNGGDHAYIKAATIRRYLAEHPGRRPHQILDDYLSRIGNKTYRNSCIFHGTEGCTLTRELRSDTCNQHFCGGLLNFQRQYSASVPARGFFMSVRGRTVRDAIFADRESAHPVPSLDP